MSRPYTTDTLVRNYINSQGLSDFGTNIIGTTQVAQKITNADNYIDAKLSKRYNTPFATTPPFIETASTILAAWWTLRSVYSGEIPAAVEFVQDDFNKGTEMIREIREYEIDLPSGTSTSGATITEKGAAGNFWSSNEDYVPVFDMGADLNWRVDPDLVSDLADEK